MIKIRITKEMKERARERCLRDQAKYGFYNSSSSSFRDVKKRYLGFLGEEVISSFFNTPLVNKTDYDIILNGYRVEIKSQSLNKHRVKNTYEVHSLKLCEDCDKYIFVMVHNSFEYAWFIGHIPKEDFNARCKRIKFKGNLEYVLPISELEEVF